MAYSQDQSNLIHSNPSYNPPKYIIVEKHFSGVPLDTISDEDEDVDKSLTEETKIIKKIEDENEMLYNIYAGEAAEENIEERQDENERSYNIYAGESAEENIEETEDENEKSYNIYAGEATEKNIEAIEDKNERSYNIYAGEAAEEIFEEREHENERLYNIYAVEAAEENIEERKDENERLYNIYAVEAAEENIEEREDGNEKLDNICTGEGDAEENIEESEEENQRLDNICTGEGDAEENIEESEEENQRLDNICTGEDFVESECAEEAGLRKDPNKAEECLIEGENDLNESEDELTENEDDRECDPLEREDYLKVMTDAIGTQYDFEEGLEVHMLEFITSYVYAVLEDASEYSFKLAGKEEIDLADVQLAIEMLQEKSVGSPLSPMLLLEKSRKRNIFQMSNSLEFTLPKVPTTIPKVLTRVPKAPTRVPKAPCKPKTISTGNTDSNDLCRLLGEKDKSTVTEYIGPLFGNDRMEIDESKSCSSITIADEPMDIDEPSTSRYVPSRSTALDFFVPFVPRFAHFFTGRRSVDANSSKSRTKCLLNSDNDKSSVKDISTSKDREPSMSPLFPL